MTFSACICCLLFCCLALVVHVICVLARISNPHGRRANGMQDFHLVGVWRLGSAGDARQCAVVATTCTEMLGAGSVDGCQRGSVGARKTTVSVMHLLKPHHSSFFWSAPNLDKLTFSEPGTFYFCMLPVADLGTGACVLDFIFCPWFWFTEQKWVMADNMQLHDTWRSKDKFWFWCLVPTVQHITDSTFTSKIHENPWASCSVSALALNHRTSQT